jgi:hypothetical protein
MCDKRCACHHPERLKGKVAECTPKQIRKCHGDVPAHPCANGDSQTSARKERA